MRTQVYFEVVNTIRIPRRREVVADLRNSRAGAHVESAMQDGTHVPSSQRDYPTQLHRMCATRKECVSASRGVENGPAESDADRRIGGWRLAARDRERSRPAELKQSPSRVVLLSPAPLD